MMVDLDRNACLEDISPTRDVSEIRNAILRGIYQVQD